MNSTTKSAVITAAIGGIFTVAAGLITYWVTTSRPALSYTVTGSPEVLAASGAKRILVIEVKNTGRREIADALVLVDLRNGVIDEATHTATPGVLVKETKLPGHISLRADMLNPEDTLRVSVLFTKATLSSVRPTVTVRAPGVQGKEIKIDTAKEVESWAAILPVIAAALASALSLLLARNSRLQENLGLLLSQASASSLNQKELFAFVLDEAGLSEDSEKIRFSAADMTYRGIADYLIHRAKVADVEDKRRYLACLRTIAVQRGIVPKSLDTIRQALKQISGLEMTEAEMNEIREKGILEGDDPIAWRQQIRERIAGQFAISKATDTTKSNSQS